LALDTVPIFAQMETWIRQFGFSKIVD